MNDHFWAKVDRGGPDECWPWTAALGRSNNYGTFWFEGKQKPSHKHALELKLGRPLLIGMKALHTCDNKQCCNGAHLYEGTTLDNSRDCINRGRFVSGFMGKSFSGEQNGNHRFTEDQIREMRRLREGGMKWRDLISTFKISQGALRSILKGETWKHVK